jgi:hypothetical protein
VTYGVGETVREAGGDPVWVAHVVEDEDEDEAAFKVGEESRSLTVQE